MSFGRPSTVHVFTSTPPDRGSFPLDHDGECKEAMIEYLKCLKTNGMDNGQCRHLSKAYLKCRMDRGLMDTDEMQNLGFNGSEDKELRSKNVPS